MAPANRQYELVQATTADGVKLHGLYQPGRTPVRTTLDGAIVLHGLSGNFYGSTLNLRLADALVERGLTTVCVNTRGHDGISSSPVNGRATTIGSAFEIIDDCRHDIQGWTDFLVGRRGCSRVLLVGHSLGAIKALYAAARDAGPLEGIVALSATRLCHRLFLESAGAEKFRDCFGRASELVAAGQGNELIKVDFPFPTWMAAGAYRDKYGPEDRYDWLPRADDIRVPVLLLYGQLELRDNPAMAVLADSVKELAARNDRYRLEIVESADHFYAGVISRAAQAMDQWLDEMFGLATPGRAETAPPPTPPQ